MFSPVSLETALGVVAYGAKGKTMEEMFTTLGYQPQEAKQALQMKQCKLNVSINIKIIIVITFSK